MLYLPQATSKNIRNFFPELHTYLLQHPAVILRELKQQFPHVPKFDQTLDELVALNWIKRQDRRYTSQIASWPQDLVAHTYLEPIVAEIIAEIPPKTTLEALWASLPVIEPTEPLAAPADVIASWRQDQVSQTVLESRHGVLTYQNALPQTTIVNFFSNPQATATLQEIYQLIGDVTVDYYLDQALPKVLRAQGKNLKEGRRDIFTESLILFGLLTPELTTTIAPSVEPLTTEILANVQARFNQAAQKITTTFPQAVSQQLMVLLRGQIVAATLKMGYFNQEVSGDLADSWHITKIFKI